MYITFNCTYNKGFLYPDRYMLISILKPSVTFLSLLNIKNNNNNHNNPLLLYRYFQWDMLRNTIKKRKSHASNMFFCLLQ